MKMTRLVVEAQLPDGHEDSPSAGPVSPRKELPPSFLPHNSGHAIDGVLVAEI